MMKANIITVLFPDLPNSMSVAENLVSVLSALIDSPFWQGCLGTLDLPMVDSTTECKTRYMLTRTDDGRYGLLDVSQRHSLIVAPILASRGQAKSGDPLIKALGSPSEVVVDCTAGWGSDASHMAASGWKVIAIEANPVIFALLSIALHQSDDQRLKQLLTLCQGHAMDVLGTLPQPVDIIYLDPMYPPKPNSAAPKRPLMILQHLGLTDDLEADLLNLARRTARKRVVVKRPHYAPPLLPGCSGATRGKLVRFDIYPPLEQ